MQQSRISQLLQLSRSRHEEVLNKDLRKASRQWRAQKARSREISENLKKVMSEMNYFQSFNYRLGKEIVKKKNDLSQAESIRQRFLNDNEKKRRLQQLRLQQLNKNRLIAEKIKDQRSKNSAAVKQSVFQKLDRGNYYRTEKQRLKKQQKDNESLQFLRKKSRVEQIVQFQCNVRQSYIRKKESANNYFLTKYRRSIEAERKSMESSRCKINQVSSRLKLLTQDTARRMSEIGEISDSLKKFNRCIPKTPLSINRDKLLSKSRCYTLQNEADEQPPTITHDSSQLTTRPCHQI